MILTCYWRPLYLGLTLVGGLSRGFCSGGGRPRWRARWRPAWRGGNAHHASLNKIELANLKPTFTYYIPTYVYFSSATTIKISLIVGPSGNLSMRLCAGNPFPSYVFYYICYVNIIIIIIIGLIVIITKIVTIVVDVWKVIDSAHGGLMQIKVMVLLISPTEI